MTVTLERAPATLELTVDENGTCVWIENGKPLSVVAPDLDTFWESHVVKEGLKLDAVDSEVLRSFYVARYQAQMHDERFLSAWTKARGDNDSLFINNKGLIREIIQATTYIDPANRTQAAILESMKKRK